MKNLLILFITAILVSSCTGSSCCNNSKCDSIKEYNKEDKDKASCTAFNFF